LLDPHCQLELNSVLALESSGRANLIFLGVSRLQLSGAIRERPILDFEKTGFERAFASLVEQLRRMTKATRSVGPPEESATAMFPTELVQELAEGNCILYAGAGLANYAGFPVWRQLVRRLLQDGQGVGLIDDGSAKLLEANLADGKVDHVADDLVERLGPKYLDLFLSQIFLRQTPLPEAHVILSRMPFSAFLTTNFDELLERTFGVGDKVFTPMDQEELWSSWNNGDRLLLKLYGTLRRPETVFVGPLQFEAAMADNLQFSQFMEGLFVSRTMLFIGCSLEGIESYLRAIRFRSGHSRAHFALAGVLGTSWQSMASVLERRYGIHVIPYRAGDGIDLLHSLHELESQLAAFRPLVSRHSKNEDRLGLSKLRQVLLRDIGPFKNLEINLNSDVNILLGNNGVGKSTILRAIGAAICGEEARPFVERLIRVGARSSSITLKFEQGTYETVLTKGTAVPLITSHPSRSLEPVGVLVLGFPPLRGASGKGAPGPGPEGGMIPAVRDILPLVSDLADTRLEQLSQWIVNLDYRAKDERARTGSSSRYDALIASFFSIVSDLMEGLTLKFGKVDAVTKRVTVITDDGEVPLDYVSQGTASLMSWIGTLLQRLYDIYGHDSKPEDQPALVLIDEIDAHMHPYWQQILLSKVRKHFKNIQLIATTHSPLIVAGLESHQVFVVSREGVRNHEMKLSGLEADQILTSPLFDLADSRDPATQEKHRRYMELRQQPASTEEEERERIALAIELFGPHGPGVEEEARRLVAEIRNSSPENERRAMAEAEAFIQATLAGKSF